MYLILLILINIASLYLYSVTNPKKKESLYDDLDIPIADKPDFCREKYIDHLMSHKWMILKQSRLMIDDFKCKQCNYTVTFETSHCHHITYSDLGNEKMSQLVTLCHGCHNKIHEFHGKNAKFYPLVDKSLL